MALCTATLSPKGKEPKGVLFFCHGFSDNMSFLKRHNLCRFVREGIAVATIEYEGHGRSDGPLGLIPDFDRLVGDVVHYFQEISEQRFPGKKCFLMGEVRGVNSQEVTYG
jgi:alpha-beta hydrolase superfamily lysophospholipase